MIKRILIALIVFLLMASASAFAESDSDWFDIIYFTGYADMRADYFMFTPNTDNEDDEKTTSDIYVFEAALETHAEITDWVDADAVFYYVDSSNGDNTGRTEELTIDEFYITLSGWGVYAKMGKYYLPVGDFSSYGVGYTRPKDLFWTRVSALGIGYDFVHPDTEKEVFGLSAHIFNGDFDNIEVVDGAPETDDDMISDFAAHLFFAPTAFSDAEGYSLELGGYYLSDFTETLAGFGNILMPQDIAATPNDSSDDVVLYENDIPLYGGYLTGDFNFTEMIGLGLVAEYATTGEIDELEYVDTSAEATAISAIHGELALLIHERRVQIGGRYSLINGLDYLETAGFDPEFEPSTYSEYGGYIGLDYIEYLHLGIQGLMGMDNESNTTTKIEFQAKVQF